MVNYTNERAWTILEDCNGKRFIVLEFEGNDRVRLARWEWGVDEDEFVMRSLISRLAPKLKIRLILPMDDVKRLDVVFGW